MALRDLYSGLGFFEALPVREYSETATNGTTIDLKDYDGCLFHVHIGSFTGVLDTSYYTIHAQIGESNAAGTIVWSDVQASQVLDSVVGEEGAISAVTLGVIFSINTALTDSDTVKRFGLRNIGTHRYARLQWSAAAAGNEVSLTVGAIAVLGYPHFWPVDAAIGIDAP